METIFQKLTDFIKDAENVIIVTHKDSDLDAIGSSLCFAAITNYLGVESYFVLHKETNNLSVNKALNLVADCDLGINVVTASDVKNKIKANSLLVILDTSKRELIAHPELLDMINDKIVVDHHVVGNKNIATTKLSYINANVSSTCEILVNYLKYLNITINPLLATIMLAGIQVDTNSYNVKTNSNTFYAAAFLLEQGALNVLKKEILQEDKKQYLRRQKYLEKSYLVGDKFAICQVDDLVEKEDLAMLAERMLLFDQVEASFAIGKINDNEVAISARSLGQINVYEIMKKFAGGGHLTDAAAQITDTTIKTIKKDLLKELEVI